MDRQTHLVTMVHGGTDAEFGKRIEDVFMQRKLPVKKIRFDGHFIGWRSLRGDNSHCEETTCDACAGN